MPRYPIEKSPHSDALSHSSALLLPNPPQHHTQLQHGCAGIPVDPRNQLHVVCAIVLLH
jgi:hypothetical protein